MMLPALNRTRTHNNQSKDNEKDCVKVFSNEESFNIYLKEKENQVRCNKWKNNVLKNN